MAAASKFASVSMKLSWASFQSSNLSLQNTKQSKIIDTVCC